MINLTIDGKTVEVPEGTTVLKAAQKAGSQIPTLCEFPALHPYGGCRLCVVEIDGFRTLQASCTLPASNGMVVRTNTPKLQAARKFVLSMIFSERNHFCMYCQKTGGDCELQNAAYGEGMDHWPLLPNWSAYPVDASHPYFVIDHNRCILCRRCVRACGELVGNFTLSIENRGYSSMLIADYDTPIGESTCVRCGTCLQVCPTGAIIDRHSAYLGSDASMERIESVCVGCSVGCGIEMVVRDNQLVRIDGNWEDPINGGVLCETGHFKVLENELPRLETPLIRKNGNLEPASWEEALDVFTHRLKDNGVTSGNIAAIASTRLTAEALFAFKTLFKDFLGSMMVTSTEETATFAVQRQAKNGVVSLNGSLESLKQSDCVVAVGVDLFSNHQVAGFFVKRNLPLGTRLVVIDPAESKMAEAADVTIKFRPGSDARLLLGMAVEIVKNGAVQGELDLTINPENYTLDSVSQAAGVDPKAIQSACSLIAAAKNPVFVYGKGITSSATPEALNALVILAKAVGVKELVHPKGNANSMAALRYGLDQAFNPKGYGIVYLALGDEVPGNRLLENFGRENFLAVQASYSSPITDSADVVFPVAKWMEQDGNYINMDGHLQEACRAVQAPPQVWSNVSVFDAIAMRLGFHTETNWQDEIKAAGHA